MHAIGIDIGGTKIAGGLVAEDGAIIRQERRPTPAGDGGAIIQAVVEVVESLRSSEQVSAVGVAAPGFIDAAQSTVYYTPNIPWRSEPLRADLSARLPGLDITIDNDANAAGWAEYRFGAGRGYRDMTLLTIGTGVGGAIVADGRLLRGGFGAAAEIGHMRVVPGGLPCGCGQRGCIEQYGSGRALLRFAGEIADQRGIGQALAAAREEHGELDGHLVYDLIVAEDPGALYALRELGGWLGQAAASLSAVLDPEVFVFGGGVAAAGELLLEPIREAYLAHLPARGFHPEPTFATAELVNDAGVVGAADIARLHASTRSA
ncbi:ROK family glucokinase [Protaetiibacter mangrovi]|uniref:Glucokinase n=1 Tax=Protaetiibacter mangrovi TaxID=2970926 RepID=A0ABT1ZB92_9MICO|nr:ROK family glucokinase [Protaetiibacter mangrovi]MCS0497964.1 ROK family glucokinase [Protaetiibacter mangrovi]TPX03097.1 ROK family glucokinase [Schumannella luteola]